MSTTVYVSIGNSDDWLSQREWAEFVSLTNATIMGSAKVHGEWFSAPDSPWQNACWCAEFATDREVQRARTELADLRVRFRQDSITWAVAETEFIGGEQTRAWVAEGSPT